MMKQQKWRCQLCEFDNVAELPHCQMCQTPKANKQKRQGNIRQSQETKQPGITCPNKECNFYNLLSSQNCVACDRYLFDGGKMNPENKYNSSSNKKLIFCYKCRFENDRTNTYCVQCEAPLKNKVFPNKSVGLFGAGKSLFSVYCQECGSLMEQCAISNMGISTQSYSDYICPKCAIKNGPQKKLCVFCDKHLEGQESEYHNSTCEQRTKFFKRQNNHTFDRCTKRQIQTVYHMHNKYQKYHQQKKQLIYQRVRKLGYSIEDFQNLHHYIINYAPIIIHVSFQRNLVYYLKDTHYRNQFEVRGGCPSRVQWEDRMFDNFHHTISGYERVKYGTMNFTNDPQGVIACGGYGQSYLLLKSHVRDRCTITDMDSASPTATIATFRFIFHLLLKLKDQQLVAAFEGSKGKEIKSNVIYAYKQIQIHGPVEFSKDIERVYVCKQQISADYQNLLNMIKEFCSKNKLQYELFDKKPMVNLHLGFGEKAKVISAPERIINNEKQKQQNQRVFQKARKEHPIKKSRKH